MTNEETSHKFDEVTKRIDDFERLLRMNLKDWFTVSETAFILGVQETSLRRMMHYKRIEFYKKNGMVTFTKQQIEDYRLKGARLKDADYRALMKKLDEVKEQERRVNKKLRRLKRLELLADELLKTDEDYEDDRIETSAVS